MQYRVLAVMSALIALALGGGTGRAQPVQATANLLNTDGVMVGVVQLTQDGDHVVVQAAVGGLPPGFHGFHIHAVGSCEAATGFMSAGGHFNPMGVTHADHAGDMPSLLVNGDGTGLLQFMTDRFMLAELFDADGSAIIVHADPDNFANIPTRYVDTPDQTTLDTGDAGARIACGLIQ